MTMISVVVLMVFPFLSIPSGISLILTPHTFTEQSTFYPGAKPRAE